MNEPMHVQYLSLLDGSETDPPKNIGKKPRPRGGDAKPPVNGKVGSGIGLDTQGRLDPTRRDGRFHYEPCEVCSGATAVRIAGHWCHLSCAPEHWLDAAMCVDDGDTS